MSQISVPVSVGDLIDKITILEIKSERITDSAKLSNVHKELDLLRSTWRDCAMSGHDIVEYVDDLKEVNQTLWEIEDDIRVKELEQTFDQHFIELARSVYRNNDRRAALKRRINEATGSELIEEKDYPGYV